MKDQYNPQAGSECKDLCFELELLEPRCLASVAPLPSAVTVATPTTGKTYYISPTGSELNTGKLLSPWPSVKYALSQVGGGNTFILKPGTYAPIQVGAGYGGTGTNATVIKAQYKWRAVVDGRLNPKIPGVGGLINMTEYVTVDGLKITNAGTFGINLSSNNWTAMNCWVTGSSLVGIGGWGHVNLTAKNNLVEYNGASLTQDHGIYLSGNGLTITGNVARHNSGCGIAAGKPAQNVVIAGNLVYANRADIAYNTVGQETQPRSISINNNTLLQASTGGLLLWGVNLLSTWKGNRVETATNAAALDAIKSNNVSDYSTALSQILPPAATGDTTPPKGKVYYSGLSGEGVRMVMVRYTDNQSLNPKSVGESNVRIMGPNGYKTAPSAVHYMLLRDSKTMDVMYLLPEPSGGWTSAYNGTFTVGLASRQICDMSSCFAAPGNLGTFNMSF